LFSFLRTATPEQRRSLLAASLGWMLDSMDVQIYALVLLEVMSDLDMDAGTGGDLAALTLLASAVGGFLFGVLADRVGRTRALMASILLYSVFTAACGFAQTVTELAVFRLFLGLGFGGEWATGAALVAETWPAEHRGKALGIMQSSWAIGYALAATLTAILLPVFGWRGVFFAGILPALITVWIRRRVPEPEIWIRLQREGVPRASGLGLSEMFSSSYRRHAIVATLMNAGTMFAWWGLSTWIPTFLKRPAAQGGAGLTVLDSSIWIIAISVGQFLGYITFGFIADRIGRRKAYLLYLLVAAAVVPLYGFARAPAALLVIGPLVGFFGTGYFSGFGAITAELFPTRIRVTAQGFTYNVGRIASAAAPSLVGRVSDTSGFAAAFLLVSAAFLFSAGMSSLLPETKGKALD
jgi:MFS family permease